MYIVADIGGSKTRIAGCASLEQYDAPSKFDTSQDYREGITRFCDAVRQTAGNRAIEAIAIGVPGPLSDNKRTIGEARHLPQWVGHELAGDIEKALSTRVFLENDTAQVGLGEAVYGAGMGAPVVFYMTVSTGVNGVRIIGGAIDRGRAEMGGQYLDADGVQTLEDLISGTVISKRFGKPPKEVAKDDPVWEELAKITAVGVHNSILHWSPDRVVLGGSMFNEIGIPVESVATHVKRIMKKFSSVPEIVHSTLKDEGGLWGGLALLRQGFKG